MKAHLVLASALLVLACRQQPAEDSPAAPQDADANEASVLPDADINASLGSLGEDPLRPGETPPRFVGLWAAEARLCADTAWRFTRDGLETPAGSVCRFDEVREVRDGYDIAASCTAEAPERNDMIRLRFPESAGGMLFESDSIADAGLVRCED